MAMRFGADAQEELLRYKNAGFKFPHASVEAARMATTAARLMDTYQRMLLTIDRIRDSPVCRGADQVCAGKRTQGCRLQDSG
jgi:hypothetical protein